MKKVIYFIMLISLVVISACRKSDNATMLDGIVYLNQPQITKVAEGFDLAISFQEPLAFKGRFTTGLYFDNDTKPKYLDIVIVKNGDVKNPKMIRSEISTFPTDVDVTGAQIVQLFGAIALGDNYDIGANYITAEGKTYEAFPKNGEAGYGSGVSIQPGASPTIRYTCICKFDIDDFIGDGNFAVVEDAWGDYKPGQDVKVKKLSETQLDFTAIDPLFSNVKVDINPADNLAKVASMLLGTQAAVTEVYGSSAYGSLTISTAGNVAASFVDPCKKELTLNIQYILSNYGNQGAYKLVLKKK